MWQALSLRFRKHVVTVGMYVVVMGYEGRSHPDKPLKDKGHVKQLQEAVNALHEAGAMCMVTSMKGRTF